MRCDAKPQNMSPAVPHDQQSIEHAKRDCRHDEHIHRSDSISVVAEECPPALGRRVSSPDHVLGHARLSDIDAELEQLSMDPRLCLSEIKSGYILDAIRRGLDGKEYALPSLRCVIGAHPCPRPSACASHYSSERKISEAGADVPRLDNDVVQTL